METTVIISSIVIANILGVILHYTHKRKSENVLIHIISAINESTWEHLKLAFMPMLLIACVQSFILTNTNIFEANLYAILTALLLIPISYYLSLLIFKKNPVWVNILIFIKSVILGYLVEYLILINTITILGEISSILLLLVLLILFSVFTFTPPKIFLFKDPIKRTYGHKV